MSLDERYVVAYHHCRRCARSIRVLRSSGPMDSATTGFSGPLFYAIFRSMAHHFRRFRKMVSSRSWSLTASYSTGPQIRNRWRAVAPQDFATPGIDRVRQECATTGLQIPLERQYGDLTLASAHSCTMAFDIVAPQFLQIDALRAEYQNPRMGCSEFEWK